VRLESRESLDPPVLVMAVVADIADEERLRARLLSAAGRAP
jgi:hypothetical protein